MGSPLWMVVPQENDESNHAKPVGILTLHVWIPLLLLLPLFCSKRQAVGNCSASGCEDASMLQIHASDDSMLQTAASATCTWKLSALGAWRHVVVWSFSSVKDSRFFSQMIKQCLFLPSKLGTWRRNFLLFSRKQLCSGLQTGKVRSRPAESPFRLEQKVIFHRLTWIQEGSRIPRRIINLLLQSQAPKFLPLVFLTEIQSGQALKNVVTSLGRTCNGNPTNSGRREAPHIYRSKDLRKEALFTFLWWVWWVWSLFFMCFLCCFRQRLMQTSSYN